MNQMALNLIAISVFTMTMTSLLGPLLHISPFVPAGVVAVVMSVATVDSLSLQGRGISVFLDAMTRLFGGADYAQRIAQHEAGHFLIAALLQIPITGYTLNAWEALRQGQPGLGGVTFDVQALEQELQQMQRAERLQASRQLLDRYCTVWMAGIAAESLLYAAPEGGTDDRQKLRTLWGQLRLSEAEILQRERWAILQAKTLLQAHWSAYEALVTAMTERCSVEECYRIALSDSAQTLADRQG